MATLTAVLLASLFGSLHCVGMCGPLMAFAVGTADGLSQHSRWGLQVAFHAGRLTTYALLGAICGLLGQALDLGGSLLGWNRVAVVLAGSMMVAVGVLSLLRYWGWRLPHVAVPPRAVRWLLWGQRAALGLAPWPRALTIGLLTALLPCGWLYGFAVIALGSGSAAWGAAIMAAFWTGTVPVLVALGTGIQSLTGALGRRLPLITSLVLVGLGLYTLVGRAHAVPAAALESLQERVAGQSLSEQVHQLRESTPPCCHHEQEK